MCHYRCIFKCDDYVVCSVYVICNTLVILCIYICMYGVVGACGTCNNGWERQFVTSWYKIGFMCLARVTSVLASFITATLCIHLCVCVCSHICGTLQAHQVPPLSPLPLPLLSLHPSTHSPPTPPHSLHAAHICTYTHTRILTPHPPKEHMLSSVCINVPSRS